MAAIVRLALVRPGPVRRATSTLLRSFSSTDYGLSDEAAASAKQRDELIRKEHLGLNTAVPLSSLAPGAQEVDADGVRRKRLVYRSKQRLVRPSTTHHP